MSVIKITEQQKARLLELYYTPTSDIKTKDFTEIIEQEFGMNIPYNLMGEFYQKAFGLDIKARKRKHDFLRFEVDGKEVILNGESENEEENEESVETLEPIQSVVEDQQEDGYRLHPKEPQTFNF